MTLMRMRSATQASKHKNVFVAEISIWCNCGRQAPPALNPRPVADLFRLLGAQLVKILRRGRADIPIEQPIELVAQQAD